MSINRVQNTARIRSHFEFIILRNVYRYLKIVKTKTILLTLWEVEKQPQHQRQNGVVAESVDFGVRMTGLIYAARLCYIYCSNKLATKSQKFNRGCVYFSLMQQLSG